MWKHLILKIARLIIENARRQKNALSSSSSQEALLALATSPLPRRPKQVMREDAVKDSVNEAAVNHSLSAIENEINALKIKLFTDAEKGFFPKVNFEINSV